MKVRTTKETELEHGIRPVGTEIDHPESWRLCEMGVAEPIDDEAKAKWAEREVHLEKTRANIRAAAESAKQQAAEEEAEQTAARHEEFEAFLKEGT